MPPAPGLVIQTWAVTPSRRSCSVSRNPVFIASAITNVATPAATPITENAVTRRSTAGRYGDRKYRLATNHSNFMLNSSGLRPLLRIRWRLRPQLREQNDVTDGGRVRKEHRQAVRSEEHTSELQSRQYLVCRLLLEKKNKERLHPQHAKSNS